MTHKTARTIRARHAAILAATAAMTLTGCTSEPLAPAERPDITWPDGEPEGPLEDSLWVQAIRASDTDLRVAEYARDFTIGTLGQTTKGDRIHGTLEQMRRHADDENWHFPLGPTPMIPIHVEEEENGTATVYACTAQDFSVTASQPEPEEPLTGWIEIYHLVLEDGQPKVDYSSIGTVEGAERELGEDVVAPFLDDREGSDCNLDDAKIGLFDPAPDVTVEYTAEDIKTSAED